MLSTTAKCIASSLIAIIMVSSIPEKAFAQRTMQSQKLLTLEATTGILPWSDIGLQFSYGSYLLRSYWNVELNSSLYSVLLSSNHTMENLALFCNAKYMHRIVQTRSRVFNLYAGGGAFLGYEMYDPGEKLPPEIELGIDNGAFLYGILPRIESELFFCEQAAVIIGFSLPINFSSHIKSIHTHLTVGVRLNL